MATAVVVKAAMAAAAAAAAAAVVLDGSGDGAVTGAGVLEAVGEGRYLLLSRVVI